MHFEKHLLPKKPLYAERGEGCALSKTRCLPLSISARFERALPPHRMNTVFCVFWDISSITLSVNHAQPHFECEFARCSRTVNVVFKSSTPSRAHLVRSPQSGSVMPQIVLNLFVDIFERRRQGHARLYRTAQPVRLTWFVVGVLPPYHNFPLV